MIIYLKKYRYLNDTPGDTGGTETGGAASTPSPAPAPEPSPAPAEPSASAPTAPEGEAFAKLGNLLDSVGTDKLDENAAPGAPPAAPSPASAAKAPVAPPADQNAADLEEPEGITERAKGRWAQLAERARQLPELQDRLSQSEGQLNSVRELVQGSGLDQVEFQNVLEIGRLYKSSTPAEMQKALDQIEGLRADLAIRLGKDVQGVDLLANHPDLKADVEGMLIPRERAMEIVRLRNAEQQMQRQNTITQETRQTHQQIQQAAQQMDATLAQRANTPGHAEKVQNIKAYLSDPARLNAFVTTYQPHQWNAAILMMYDTFQSAPAARAVPVVQPLRPGVTATGHRAGGTARTAEDAVEGAFARLGL